MKSNFHIFVWFAFQSPRCGFSPYYFDVIIPSLSTATSGARQKSIEKYFKLVFFLFLRDGAYNNSSKTGARHHSLEIRRKMANILKYLEEAMNGVG